MRCDNEVVADTDLARALASHARGHWFESSTVHHRIRAQYGPPQNQGLSGRFRSYDCGTAPVKARFYKQATKFYKQATKVKSCLLAP